MSHVRFIVYGAAQPAGSKTAFPFHKAGGKLGVRVSDSNPKAKSWKQDVAACALQAVGGGFRLLDGPLVLTVTFFVRRPAGHLGARGLRPKAPPRPITKPDATKLLRGLEDALKGVLFNDDSQIVTQHVEKWYAANGESVRTEVEIHEWEAPSATLPAPKGTNQ